jgi:hypothetical protein
MTKRYLGTKAEVVGMYITDTQNLNTNSGGSSHWMGNADMPYLPLLNYISIAPDDQVRLASAQGIGKDITTYNTHYGMRKFTNEVVKSSKLPVAMNDLLVGPVNLAFNFTERKLTLTSSSGIPKSFTPLSLDSLAQFKGKLILMSIHTLNSMESIEHQFGELKYIRTLRERLIGKADFASKELIDIYDYVIKCVGADKGLPAFALSDTYKVATMVAVDVEELVRKEGCDSIYLVGKRIDISLENIVKVSPHEALIQEYVQDKVVMDTIRANGFACYIVDTDSSIGERYMNLAGMVVKVPKLKDRDKVDGFFLMSLDANKRLSADNFTPLEEVKAGKLRFLYASIEEAEVGADMKNQYADQLEMLKLEKLSEGIALKSQHERDMRELEQLSRKRSNDIEQEHRARINELDAQRLKMNEEDTRRKLDFEETVRQMKADSESKKQATEFSKFNFDQNRYQMDNSSLFMKRNYEEGKYERDSTIETIKTVGAVAGLIAGGYVLFKKFS